MFDCKKGSGWTVSKLITMILLILILVLIVAGVTSGGLTPLFEKMGGYMDNVLAKLGGTQKQVVEGGSSDCGDWKDATGISRDAKFRVCNGYCEIKLGDSEEDLYTYSLTDNKLKNDEGIQITGIENYDPSIKDYYLRILRGGTEMNNLQEHFSGAIKEGEYYYFIKGRDLWRAEGKTERVTPAQKTFGWLKDLFISKYKEYNAQEFRVFDKNTWLDSKYSKSYLESYLKMQEYLQTNCD